MRNLVLGCTASDSNQSNIERFLALKTMCKESYFMWSHIQNTFLAHTSFIGAKNLSFPPVA